MKISVATARNMTSLALGRTAPANDSQRRYARIMRSAVTALGSKGVSVLVSFIAVPLTINYLGVERYGVWLTISTLLVWLSIADLGLGNGLTNALSEAYGLDRPDLAQRYVATSFWILVAVSVGLGLLCVPLYGWIDWVALFNVQTVEAQAEVDTAVALVIGLFLLSFPLSIVPKIFGAYQEGYIANYWAAAGNIASLVALLIVTRTQGGLIALVAAISVGTTLVSIASAVWLFSRHKPWLRPSIFALERTYIHRLATTGGMFFVVQIAVLLNFQTDNVIIAHYLGASAVTPYSVTWRLFSYTTLLQSLIFPALWPAYTEAFVRKDLPWVRRTFRANVIGSTTLTTLLVIPLVYFGTTIIEMWAGPNAVPPFALLVWMGGWNIIYAFMIAGACVLNASNRIKGQSIYGIAAGIVNILLSLLLVNHYGITGVVAATVISYVFCAVIPQHVEVMRVIRGEHEFSNQDAT